MTIIPLGIGSALSKTAYNTNFLVESSSGKRLLVDCGYTAFRSLLDLRLTFSHIDGVLITHLHGDHVLGLERLAIETQIVSKKKIPLWIADDLADVLWDHVLSGLLGGTWRDPQTGKTREKTLSDYFLVHRLQPDEPFDACGISTSAFSVPHLHGRPAYGYLLQEGQEGKVAMLVPDANGTGEYLPSYGAIADVIFHDCFSRVARLPSHTAFTLLEALPEELREKLILVHGDDDELEAIEDLKGMRVARQHERFEV